jgi:hypothetical protein
LLVMMLASIPLLHIHNWFWLVAIVVVLVQQIVQALRAFATGRIKALPVMLGNFMLAVVVSRLAGVFVLTPILICGAMLALAGSPAIVRRPWVLFAWVAGTVLVPVGLEWIGVFDPTWQITEHAIEIRSATFSGTGPIVSVSLLIANLVVLGMLCWYALALARSTRNAQRELLMQTWQLEQLVPSARVLRGE